MAHTLALQPQLVLSATHQLELPFQCCHQIQRQHTVLMELFTINSQFHTSQLVVLARTALSQSIASSPISTTSLSFWDCTKSGLSWIYSTTSSPLSLKRNSLQL